MFCLVAIYSVIGEELKPHLAQLTGSKVCIVLHELVAHLGSASHRGSAWLQIFFVLASTQPESPMGVSSGDSRRSTGACQGPGPGRCCLRLACVDAFARGQHPCGTGAVIPHLTAQGHTQLSFLSLCCLSCSFQSFLESEAKCGLKGRLAHCSQGWLTCLLVSKSEEPAS